MPGPGTREYTAGFVTLTLKLGRCIQLVRVATPLVLRRRGEVSGAVRVRAALENLGGVWIKLGQWLALRFDLLPADYCHEFLKLLNRLEPFPYEEVQNAFVAEFNKKPEELFSVFEREPFAAASIGQVHRAVLHTGERVAVKIQRPDIRRLVEADLSLMLFLARLLDFSHLFGDTQAAEIVDQFARWTRKELDYRTEARHAYALADNARGDGYEINARVIASLTSGRVLTTELLEGVPVIDLIEAIRDGNASFLDGFRANGYDLALVARYLTWNTLNQVYVSGYFHADPHPANLIVLPGNAIGYVDFGIVGQLSDDLRDSLRFFARHLFAGEVDTAVSELMRWVRPSLATDVAAAREELMLAMDRYLASRRASGHSRPFAESTIYEVDILRVVHRHRMIMSPQIVMYLKAVLTAESVIHQLVPTFDLLRHENLFFGRLIEQETFAALRPERIARAVSDYSYRIRRVLDQVEELEAAPTRLEDLAFEVRRRLHWLAFAALAFATAFYFAIRSPHLEALRAKYAGISRSFLSLVFLALLVLVLLMMVRQGRRLPRYRRGRRRRSRQRG